jgi:predicted component of type VI protein secretion system
MASVVLSFSGREVKTYELDKPATVVGRDPGVDIVVDNLGVSRSHCQFLKRGDVFVIQDMNSSNGTYVNGKRVTEHNLNDNDQIVVGKYTLTYKAQGKAAAKAGPGPAGVIPDSLNTYMMDGDKIRERLEDMRREEEAKASAAARKVEEDPRSKRGGAARPPSAPAMAPAAPAVSRTDRHARIVMGGSSSGGLSVEVLKRYLMLSLVLNLVLIVAFGVFYFFYLQGLHGENAEPAGSRPRLPVVDPE